MAGTLGLGKLIAFWDDNDISIDGHIGDWMEKGAALQSPVGDPVQTQVAVNGEENTKLNQSPVWRPARMDFRRK